MFDTLLIANRGEIACRVARTARRIGLRTVAVFSDADRSALHVATCDVAVRIGPPEAARSYLDAEAIVAAAHATGAQAVHPGYGFLSESLALIDACESAGIVFVGPSREAIRRMGSKIESKRIALECGVPVVPGYHGDDQDADVLLAAAKGIGYPVLIKASAGGGGKGLRVVGASSEFVAALDTVRREARASFGDDRVLLERYLVEPRHLEVQLLGDRHGHLVHLFERECSIQRNHQKVIEEAPAAHLAATVREDLFSRALTMGRAIDYYSTGTVEFIHDAGSGETFFLEMNTRLQVEHPVTEATVGIDLIEWQLRIAAGEALAFEQGQLGQRGWAIEARVCAEDPAAGFAPQTGRIVAYVEPVAQDVRVDSGVRAGSVVTPYYDSMLAKVIAHADSRENAARRLTAALDRYELLGVRTNLGFLADLLRESAFNDPLSTHYIERAFPGGWRVSEDSVSALAVAGLACAMAAHTPTAASPWASLGAWRVLGDAARCGVRVLLEDGTQALHEVRVSAVGARWQVQVGGYGFDCHALLDGDRLEVERDGVVDSWRWQCVPDVAGGERVWLSRTRGAWDWRRVDRWRHALSGSAVADGDSGELLRAPMPGLVTAVPVMVGTRVVVGDPLVLMEAMKMVHTLNAPSAGRVVELRCRVGDAVRGGDVLIVVEPGDKQ